MHHKLLTLWYKLTAHIPRPLPTTEEEFVKLKDTLMLYFGVEDSQVGWITVASEIQNTKTASLRKRYSLYANAAKKIEINGMCENQKRLEGAKLSARLKEIAEKVVAKGVTSEPVPDGSSDSKADMQVVS